jgi:hypothetical protein
VLHYEVEERISTHPSFRLVPAVIIRLEGKEMKTLKLSEETGSEKEMGVRSSTMFLTLPFQMNLIITPIKSNYSVQYKLNHLAYVLGLRASVFTIHIRVRHTIPDTLILGIYPEIDCVGR